MQPGRRPLIAGNWKMNGLKADSSARVRNLATLLRGAAGLPAEIVVCPPATQIAAVVEAAAGTPILVGGQDCHGQPKGAHTGDVSAPMLADLGCRYVIVGHSERRANHGEGDALVAAKAAAVRAAGLVPIICIGETAAERNAGQAVAVAGRQIDASVPAGTTPANTVIAYEPVWAIGTGRTPTIEEIAEMHAAIRARLVGRFGAPAAGVRVLYGGSMKPENAGPILQVADVDGGLIGGASLEAADFFAICRASGPEASAGD
ncbi:MAG: triose-phosphate isomerase [Alphaproteobacteria bacterium]|nr:triose-phosphate isomerase [Alphaproteobacteria bacterium]